MIGRASGGRAICSVPLVWGSVQVFVALTKDKMTSTPAPSQLLPPNPGSKSPAPGISPRVDGHRVSLAFTTIRRAKLFLVGRKANSQIAVFERVHAACMGLWGDGQTLWLSTQFSSGEWIATPWNPARNIRTAIVSTSPASATSRVVWTSMMSSLNPPAAWCSAIRYSIAWRQQARSASCRWRENRRL